MEQFLEFIMPMYNFANSIGGVLVVGFFAMTGIIYEKVQNKKLNAECHRLNLRVIELEKADKNE